METDAVSSLEVSARGEDAATRDDDTDRFHAAFLWTACALMVVGLWIRPMMSSLWVDETGTWWVIEGGARQVVQRAEAVQGQSPFYYLFLWAWTHVAGHSEVAMRVPSFVFSLVTLGLVYLIAKRLFDVEVGRLAAVAYAAWHQVVFEASNARPYALVVMLVVAAAWLLISWLDAGGVWRGVAFVAVAALVPYAHPVPSLALIPLFAFALVRVRERSTQVQLLQLLIAGLAVVLLAVPVAYEVAGLAGRHGDWSIPATVSVSLILTMLVPSAFAAVALLSVLLIAVMRVRVRAQPIPRATRVLLGSWLLVPSGILFAMALFSSVQLLGTRYFLMIAPAGAIITAALLRALKPAQVRRVIVLLLALLAVLDLSASYKVGDIRGAMALVRSRADDRSVTLLGFGFRESLQTDWYDDPERASLLVAPASYYPAAGRVMALPLDSPESSLAWTRARVEAAASSSDRVLVVTLTGSPYEPWLEEVFSDRGFTSRVLGTVEAFSVTEFTPPAS